MSIIVICGLVAPTRYNAYIMIETARIIYRVANAEGTLNFQSKKIFRWLNCDFLDITHGKDSYVISFSFYEEPLFKGGVLSKKYGIERQ